MKVTIESITPKIAGVWLNSNKSNRKLREGVVEKYAEDMKNGRWTNCPEPISFYEDGDVADGQHRLWAIVESNTTQTVIVVRGLTREDGLNINTGMGRTVIDNARISGTDIGLSKSLISAARAIVHGTVSARRSLSNSEVLAMVDSCREAAMYAATTVRRKSLLCGGAVLGAVGRAYLHEPDHLRLQRFCDVLGTGFYDGEGETAAVTMRNYLLTKGPVASSSALWRDTFLKCQNAVHYFMRGKKLTTLRVIEDDVYPLLTAKRARANRAGRAAHQDGAT